MKNPDNKPLRIVRKEYEGNFTTPWNVGYTTALSNLAIAQSNLVKAGKDSAMPHFIAIVKELERIYGFEFEIIDD